MSNTLFSAGTGIYCEQCKGSCRGKDPAETQRNAHEKFGITPNNCIPDCNGTSHCPYAKK